MSYTLLDFFDVGKEVSYVGFHISEGLLGEKRLKYSSYSYIFIKISSSDLKMHRSRDKSNWSHQRVNAQIRLLYANHMQNFS